MFKILFKRTTATLFFIIVSGLIFGAGYYIGGLPDNPSNNNEVSEKQKIILPVFIGYIPIAITALNFFINSKVDEESKNKIESNEEKCKSKIKSYAFKYFKVIDMVETQFLAGKDDETSQQIKIELIKARDRKSVV